MGPVSFVQAAEIAGTVARTAASILASGTGLPFRLACRAAAKSRLNAAARCSSELDSGTVVGLATTRWV